MFLNMHLARDTVTSAPGDMSLDKAEIVAVLLECSLYGIEALNFVATVYILHGVKRTKAMILKFGVVILMFMLNTIHIGAVFRRTLNAFIGPPAGPLPDPAAYLADLSGFLYRFMNIIIVIQFIMLDVLVVYRCYMIWEKRIVVTIVPSLGVVAILVTGIAAIRAYATDTTDTVFTGQTRTWVSAMLCFTLFTKLVCFATVLAGTVLPRPNSSWHSVYLRVNRHTRLYKCLLVGVESGGLAVFGAIILIPVFLAGRNAQATMLAVMSPLTGQSFLLIITAALLGLTPSDSKPSRRRKLGRIPSTGVSIPPSISPDNSVPSHFSTTSVLKPKSPSSYCPSTPRTLVGSEYSGKSFLKVGSKTAEPASAYTDSRYPRGYVHGEPLPFSTTFAQREPSSDTTGSHETLPYGDGESIHISISSRQEVNIIPKRSESPEPEHEPGVFPLGKGADGVVVLQKEYVP